MKPIKISRYTLLIVGIIIIGISIPFIRNYKVKLQEKKRLEVIDARTKNTEKIESIVEKNIVVFYSPYNSSSLLAMEFFDKISQLDINVIRRKEGEPSFYMDLRNLKNKYGTSTGSSSSFEFYPIIFYKDMAYSGFNNKIERMILKSIGVKDSNLPKKENPCYLTDPVSQRVEEVSCSLVK